MTAPLIGPIEIDNYLATGQIEQVIADAENYAGARPCNFDWVKSLSEQCRRHDITFCFIGIGNRFIKDGKEYRVPKLLQSEMALKANVNHIGRPMQFRLCDPLGFEIDPDMAYSPYFKDKCARCGNRPVCNGCSQCNKCMVNR